MKQQLIPLSNANQWNDALAGLPIAAAHQVNYQQAIAQSSEMATFLYVAEDANFRAVCPLAVREYQGTQDIITPYGYAGFSAIGYYPEFEKYWYEFAKGQEWVCGHIAMHPLFQGENLFGKEIIYPGNTMYFLDITQPWDILLKNLEIKHRYRLKQWQKQEITISYDKDIAKKHFVTLYQETLTRVQAAPVYHFAADTLQNLIDDKDSMIVAGIVNGCVESILLFLCTNQVAEYFLTASTSAGQQHTRGLIWAAIAELKKRNIPCLNLGAGVKTGDSLCDFKRRFGGIAKSFNALKQVYDEEKYKALCQANGFLYEPREGYFPPYHAPAIKSSMNYANMQPA